MSATIADYFCAQLGDEFEPRVPNPAPYSAHHPEFTIDTPCGEVCRAVIDAAANLLAFQLHRSTEGAANAGITLAYHLGRAFLRDLDVDAYEASEEPLPSAQHELIVQIARRIVRIYIHG